MLDRGELKIARIRDTRCGAAGCDTPVACQVSHTRYPPARSRPTPKTTRRLLCAHHAAEYAVNHGLEDDLRAALQRFEADLEP